MLNSTKVASSIFTPALIVSKTLIFVIFNFENSGKNHGGEKLDLRYSMANVQIFVADFVIVLAAGNMSKRTKFTYTQREIGGADYRISLQKQVSIKTAGKGIHGKGFGNGITCRQMRLKENTSHVVDLENATSC